MFIVPIAYLSTAKIMWNYLLLSLNSNDQNIISFYVTMCLMSDGVDRDEYSFSRYSNFRDFL